MGSSGLYPASLDPPALSADDVAAAEEKMPWALLELVAYVAKRENATTASSKSWDGKQVQVTFCTRRPPHISYLCVHSPDAEIHTEPEIIATDEDLVLLRITVGSDLSNVENINYFAYQSDNGSGQPSLNLLPRPPCDGSFDARDMGILSYVSDEQPNQSGILLRHHLPGHTEYIVAGIVEENYGLFTLYLYDSGQGGDWKTHTVSLNHQQQQQYGGDDFYHKNTKVMAIGGQEATMAFIDLWRGILFCDVRKLQHQAMCRVQTEAIPLLCYLPLPSSIKKNKVPKGDPRLWRNIALFNGCFKYVELQLHWKPSVVFEGHYLADGWKAATFSRPTSSSWDGDSCSEDCYIDPLHGDSWCQDCYIDSNETNFRNDPYLNLLPKAPSDEGITALPFKRLYIRQPVLGLQEGADIIYFTTKVARGADTAWMVGMDMRNKALLGVAAFSAERMVSEFTFLNSKISKHLKPGAQGNLKRQGSELVQPSSKKNTGIEGTSLLAEDADQMILD